LIRSTPLPARPARATALLCALLLAASACAEPEHQRKLEPGGRTVLMAEDDEDAKPDPSQEAKQEEPPPQPRRPPRLETEADDARAGSESARQVAAEMGFVKDEALQAYVEELGQLLAKGVGRTSFEFQFTVVDQFEPNAFALPGGYIYVSRGLLALSSTEDELANVIGHEITHAVRRHSAALQEIQRRQNPFKMPFARMGDLAAYGRDLERDADQGGQTLAARAGFDPSGMVVFLQAMTDVERVRSGASRLPGFFDTHPGSTERAANCAARAPQIPWRRGPGIAGDRAHYLHKIEGIVLGPDPAEGIFRASRFLHPDLDFSLRFPRGWRLLNTSRAVGAIAPRGNAQIFMVAEPQKADAKTTAEQLIEQHRERLRIRVQESRPIRIGEIDGYRVRATAEVERTQVAGLLTFIPYNGLMYRVVGVAPARNAQEVLPHAQTTARTFRPLSEEERSSIQVLRLRLVQAQGGESLAELGKRAGNAWDPTRTSVLNQVPASVRFEGGEWVKIVREEPYSGGEPRTLQGG
jgi:predicted Zn-dependent protease